jgi:hypothetical protein
MSRAWLEVFRSGNCFESEPQELKPNSLAILGGTAKVVPFQNS